MANRIQISEQRNGLLSRLDIVDDMFAGIMSCVSLASAPYLGVATLADSISSFSIYEKRDEVFVIIKALDCFLGVLNIRTIL